MASLIGAGVIFASLLLSVQPCERMKQRTSPVRTRASLQIGEAAAQGASIVAALTAVFSGMGGDHPLGLFYLLFPPLIWIAMRHGLPTATWAVLATQIGLIAGLGIPDKSNIRHRRSPIGDGRQYRACRPVDAALIDFAFEGARPCYGDERQSRCGRHGRLAWTILRSAMGEERHRINRLTIWGGLLSEGGDRDA
jgi:hypothetical protein